MKSIEDGLEGVEELKLRLQIDIFTSGSRSLLRTSPHPYIPRGFYMQDLTLDNPCNGSISHVFQHMPYLRRDKA
jgi:hypothetical protein